MSASALWPYMVCHPLPESILPLPHWYLCHHWFSDLNLYSVSNLTTQVIFLLPCSISVLSLLIALIKQLNKSTLLKGRLYPFKKPSSHQNLSDVDIITIPLLLKLHFVKFRNLQTWHRANLSRERSSMLKWSDPAVAVGLCSETWMATSWRPWPWFWLMLSVQF